MKMNLTIFCTYCSIMDIITCTVLPPFDKNAVEEIFM